MPRSPLIIPTDRGLYCPAGDFHIDAWKPVARNVVTHAHSDHARRGSERYLVPPDGVPILKRRLGSDITVDAIPYGQPINMNGVALSLHPAGHLLGSAQVRVEHDGQVWVFTGDYKTETDSTCKPFELVRCHTFITECTFGLPIFRWKPAAQIAADINTWWQQNIEKGRTSILLAYSLGKAQRVLAMLDPTLGPILLHGAVSCHDRNLPRDGHRAATGLSRECRKCETAQRPRNGDRPTGCRGRAPGFASSIPNRWRWHPAGCRFAATAGGRLSIADLFLSDHVDWPSLQSTITATGAEHIIATHGYTGPLVRYLRESWQKC